MARMQRSWRVPPGARNPPQVRVSATERLTAIMRLIVASRSGVLTRNAKGGAGIRKNTHIALDSCDVSQCSGNNASSGTVSARWFRFRLSLKMRSPFSCCAWASSFRFNRLNTAACASSIQAV